MRLIELAYRNPWVTVAFLIVIFFILEDLIQAWRAKD